MLKQIETTNQPLNNFIDDHGVVNLNGFAFSPHFVADLASFDLQNAPCHEVSSVFLVSAEEQPELSGFVARLQTQGTRVVRSVIDSPTDWNSMDDMGGLFLPISTLRHIAGWLDDDRMQIDGDLA